MIQYIIHLSSLSHNKLIYQPKLLINGERIKIIINVSRNQEGRQQGRIQQWHQRLAKRTQLQHPSVLVQEPSRFLEQKQQRM
jgi:hypothetical protein